MTRIPPFLLLVLASTSTGAAVASPTTLTYHGNLTRLEGPQADRFHVGDPVTITYTVDDGSLDANPLPGEGVFPGALASLRYDLPSSGMSVVTGPGTVQTFNDVSDSDQVFLYSTEALVGPTWTGGSLNMTEVDFISDHVGADGKPDLLSSDAIPVTPLVTSQVYLSFQTAVGRTYFQVQLVAEPTVIELVQDGRVQVDAMVSELRLKRGLGIALKAKLNALLLAYLSGDAASACTALTDLRNHVSALLATGQMAASDADSLFVLVEMLRISLGGC